MAGRYAEQGALPLKVFKNNYKLLNNKKMKMKQLLIFISVMCATNISAQVNIGTNDPPHAAAVLDLSQKETTAPDRGLLLPHVSLANLTDFQLIAIPDNDQKSKAAGMVVWNTGAGSYVCPGVYLWNNDKWNPLTPCPVPAVGSLLTTPLINVVSAPECGNGARFEVKATYPDLADTEKFVWSVSPEVAGAGASGEKDYQFFVPYDGTSQTYTITVYAKTNGARGNSLLSAPASATSATCGADFNLIGLARYDIAQTDYDQVVTGSGTNYTESDFFNRKNSLGVLDDPDKLDDYGYFIEGSAPSATSITYAWSVSDPNSILNNFAPVNAATQPIVFNNPLSDGRILGLPEASLPATLFCTVTVEFNDGKTGIYDFTKVFRVQDSSTGCTLPSTLRRSPYNGYVSFACYNLGAAKLSIADQLAYMAAPTQWTAGVTLSKGTAKGVAIGTSTSTDSLVYGHLYQWGRRADGHQLRQEGTNIVIGPYSGSLTDGTGDDASFAQVPTSATAFFGKFIVSPVTPPDAIPDWIATDQASSHYNSFTGMYSDRWDGVGNNSSPANPVKVIANDPCPDGWRVPTNEEWGSILKGTNTSLTSVGTDPNSANNKGTYTTWLPVAGSTTGSTAWNSEGGSYWNGGYIVYPTTGGSQTFPALFLPAAGCRQHYGNYRGQHINVGFGGYYWSSTTNGSQSSCSLIFTGNSNAINGNTDHTKVDGNSIRCTPE
jgi:uncharacterized protein (TIGR02145 family)